MKLNLEERLKPMGISTQQYGIMNLLHIKSQLTQIEIVNEMGIDRASMVRFIDGLESKKFVTRGAHEGDRRRNLISLTTLGEKELLKMRALGKACEEDFLSKLSASERESLRNLIPKLLLSRLDLPNP